jgi:hypothetical protein
MPPSVLCPLVSSSLAFIILPLHSSYLLAFASSLLASHILPLSFLCLSYLHPPSLCPLASVLLPLFMRPSCYLYFHTFNALPPRLQTPDDNHFPNEVSNPAFLIAARGVEDPGSCRWTAHGCGGDDPFVCCVLSDTCVCCLMSALDAKPNSPTQPTDPGILLGSHSRPNRFSLGQLWCGCWF